MGRGAFAATASRVFFCSGRPRHLAVEPGSGIAVQDQTLSSYAYNILLNGKPTAKSWNWSDDFERGKGVAGETHRFSWRRRVCFSGRTFRTYGVLRRLCAPRNT